MRWFLVSIGLAILATTILFFLYSEAKAETWSCFTHDGKTAVFIRKDGTFGRKTDLGWFVYEIVREDEGVIKLVNFSATNQKGD